MELSTEQIDYLFAFTKKKMVHFYDLQIEIVDHLAERIKEEMQLDSKLDFKHALDKVYTGFGIFGFAHIVQERQNALQKAGNKSLFREFKKQFSWPLILRTFCVVSAVYLSATTLVSYWFAVVIGLLMLAGVALNFANDILNIKIKRKLISFHIPTSFLSFIILQFQIQYLIDMLYSTSKFTLVAHPWLAVLMIAPGLLAIIIYWELNAKLKRQAKENYPEVFA